MNQILLFLMHTYEGYVVEGATSTSQLQAFDLFEFRLLLLAELLVAAL